MRLVRQKIVSSGNKIYFEISSGELPGKPNLIQAVKLKSSFLPMLFKILKYPWTLVSPFLIYNTISK